MGNKNSGRRTPQIKPSPDQSSFGIWLTSYLSKHKLSIMDLSRSTGITDRTIRDWIDGVNFPKIGPLLEVVEVISKLEHCFIETILMEAIQTHTNFVMAKRREAKHYSTHTIDDIVV